MISIGQVKLVTANVVELHLDISFMQLDTTQNNQKQNNNVNEWMEKFGAAASKYSYSTKILGEAFGYPIVLFFKEGQKESKKSVLLTTLFHGDESACMVALYEVLNAGLFGKYEDLAISFIPIVNPTGFELNQRMNRIGENPNRGFDYGVEAPSVEGDILLHNSELLNELTKDGFLSMHEDSDVGEGIFVYTYEKDLRAPLGHAFLDANINIMSPLNGKIITDFEKGYKEDLIADGLVLNEYGDGTYEEMLFMNNVCSIAAVTETPSRHDVPFEKRVELNKNYIKAFLDFVANEDLSR